MQRLLDPQKATRFRLSLRIQLTLWVVLIFTLIQWISTIVVWVFLSSTIYNSFNDFITQRMIEVSAEISQELPFLSSNELSQIESENLELIRFQTFHLDVFHINGDRVLEQSVPQVELDESIIDRAMKSPRPVLLDDVQWVSPPAFLDGNHLIYVAQNITGRDGGSYILFLATDDEYAQSRVMQVGQTLMIISLSTPFLSLLAGWFISRIAVTPLTRVQELVAQLTPESISEPISLEEESAEVMELVAQIDDSRDQIQSAFESQARFISNVSHELKTPIAVMQIESETIDLSESSDEVKMFVQSVRDEMTRLGKMIESFLTLTRLEDGFGKVGGKTNLFNDIVMDSIDQCISMSKQNAIELDPMLFGDEDTLELGVQGDPDLLITMLNNLIRNAIRYSPAAGVIKVHLKLGSPKEDQCWVDILIVDQGPGIPEDKIEHIFDRFSQVDGASRAGRGHGLGLAIAQGIAELHGGIISVSNNPENGCTFKVSLPATVESEH